MITLEPGGSSVSGTCPDCGNETINVWGYAYRDEQAHAVYFIRWTRGHPERGAQLAISIGAWGGDATPDGRSCIGIECRLIDGAPAYRIADAAETPWAKEAFLGRMLLRDDVIGTPLAQQVFDVLDAITADETRFGSFGSNAE
jgi:hypothetical protein